MPETAGEGPLQKAEAILEIAHADPKTTLSRASALLAETRDPEAISVLERASGIATKELNRLEDAHQHLAKAIKAAGSRFPIRAAQARMSMALVLLELGRTRDALTELDRAKGHLKGLDGGLLEMQRALVLQRLGQLDEALVGYRRALRVFKRYDDGLRETRLRINRSALHVYRGDLAAAETDLRIAQRMAAELGQGLLLGGASHNLGFLHARRQDVPAALGCYLAAEEAYQELSADRLLAVLAIDRAELMMAVGLFDEARAQSTKAVELTERGGNATDTAEALLLRARAELGAGNSTDARHLARSAQGAFLRQGRHAWAEFGRFVELQADSATQATSGRKPTATLVARAIDVAGKLSDQGWRSESVIARLIAAKLALARDDPTSARGQLRQLASFSRTGLVNVQLAGWHATALLRKAEGNLAGSRTALSAGMRLIDRYRATLAADDLRAGVTYLALELARTGLVGAMETERAYDVLQWTEALRSVALSYPSARPPTDAGLSDLLASLRDVVAELRQTALAGGQVATLEAQRARLEGRIRDRARTVVGPEESLGRVDLKQLTYDLKDRVLLSFFQLGERLSVLRLRGGKIAIFDLGPVTPIIGEAHSLRFALHRLVRGRSSNQGEAAALATMRHSAKALDLLLLAPCDLDRDEVVIVPSGVLQGLPWRALSSLSNNAVSIAPSAQSWQGALSRVRPRDGSKTLLVAGPGLPGAASEISLLARHYPQSNKLVGRRATVGAVLTAMDGADLMHLAAHGRLRHDNPLFSSLSMNDGPMTVYDFQALRRPPNLIVMPSCDTAMSHVIAGDELLGLSSGLLKAGVSSVVAPVTPVPDDATKPLMVALHRQLMRGSPPAAALAEAAADFSGGNPTEVGLAAAFVALGAG
jgi:tetratricopeptide (TPR) repeat protein